MKRILLYIIWSAPELEITTQEHIKFPEGLSEKEAINNYLLNYLEEDDVNDMVEFDEDGLFMSADYEYYHKELWRYEIITDEAELAKKVLDFTNCDSL